MPVSKEFATYACDLLGGVGPCVAKRMFGGWGISTDGLTVAILADLGSGEKLWLKADDDSAAQFRDAGCEQFTYPMKSAKAPNGVELKSMNYFAAPEEAMDSPAFMLPWARLALQAAVQAQALKATRGVKRAKSPGNSSVGSPTKSSIKSPPKASPKLSPKTSPKSSPKSPVRSPVRSPAKSPAASPARPRKPAAQRASARVRVPVQPVKRTGKPMNKKT